MEEEMLGNRGAVPYRDERVVWMPNQIFGEIMLPVPDPHHLIALKLHAMRNAERRLSGKDLPDVIQILRICAIDPDGVEFKALLDRHANNETRDLLQSYLGRR